MKNYLYYVCMVTFLTFTWEFSLWKFYVSSSVHWKSRKSVYYCLEISLWKSECCLIWALNKSILFGSNPESVSIVSFNCDLLQAKLNSLYKAWSYKKKKLKKIKAYMKSF